MALHAWCACRLVACVLSTLLRPWTVWLPPVLVAALCQAFTATASVAAASALYVYGRHGDSGPIAAAEGLPAAQAAAAGAFPVASAIVQASPEPPSWIPG